MNTCCLFYFNSNIPQFSFVHVLNKQDVTENIWIHLLQKHTQYMSNKLPPLLHLEPMWFQDFVYKLEADRMHTQWFKIQHLCDFVVMLHSNT